MNFDASVDWMPPSFSRHLLPICLAATSPKTIILNLDFLCLSTHCSSVWWSLHLLGIRLNCEFRVMKAESIATAFLHRRNGAILTLILQCTKYNTVIANRTITFLFYLFNPYRAMSLIYIMLICIVPSWFPLWVKLILFW